MNNPTIKIHNAETGDVIEREMNEEELAFYTQNQKDVAAQKADFEAKVLARQSAINKLIDLGLTEEEAKAFLG